MSRVDEQFQATPEGWAERWMAELDASEKWLKPYKKTCKNIVDRYRNERKDSLRDTDSRLCAFWSNIQVMRANLYVRPPQVDVSRAFGDMDDDVARVAGVILERLINEDFQLDGRSTEAVYRQCIDDWLIHGLGVDWWRYEVQTEMQPQPPAIDPITGLEMQRPNIEVVVSEDAKPDLVTFEDILWSEARNWQEVRWVGRRVFMSQEQVSRRFDRPDAQGAEGQAIPGNVSKYLPYGKEGDDGKRYSDPWSRAEIWEIWDRDTRTVYWLCRGYPKTLDMRPDPLGLDEFFPCPEPLIANAVSTCMIPQPDFKLAEDQYNQLDTCNQRIDLLVDACRAAGVYDKNSQGVQSLLTGSADAKLIAVDQWPAFAERGGVKGAIDWLPIDMFSAVIERLRVHARDKKEQIWEVIGIADIMRGVTQASETATAQQIKTQFGSMRLQLKQSEIAQWITRNARIKAQIVCRHFSDETIAARSNIMATPDREHAIPALQLLREHSARNYRIVIEADSIAAPNWAEKRDTTVQFLQAVGSFLRETIPLAMQIPAAAPTLLQLLQFGVSGFRAGRTIEGVIDKAIQALEQDQVAAQQRAQSQPQGPKESDETAAKIEKLMAEAKKTLIEAEILKQQLAGAAPAMMPPGQPETMPAAMMGVR